MTTSEKRLLRIALIFFIGYMLPFQIAPITYDFYRDYRDSLDSLHENIERYEELGKRTDYWKTENQRALLEQEKIEAGLLPGDTRQLAGVQMQELMRELAQKAGITFKSQLPPDTSGSTGEWVLVIQSVQFDSTSKTLMKFIKAVNENKVNLEIISLEVRTSRKRLAVTIKITGFSRISVAEEEEE